MPRRLCLALFLLLLGCPTAPVEDAEAEAAPRAGLIDQALDFGEVEFPSGEATLRIENQGDAPLAIEEVLPLDAPGVSMVGPLLDPFEVPPGSTVTLPFEWFPQRHDDLNGTLRVRTNEPERGRLEIPIFGSSLAPQVVVEPASVGLGVEPLDCTTSADFVVRNVGELPLFVRNDETEAYPFTLPPVWALMEPGEELTLSVSMTRYSEGSSERTFTLETDDPVEGDVSVHLAGMTVVSPDVTDLVPVTGQLDVLVVMDARPSSSSPFEPESLVEEMSILFDGLDATGLDYRVAVASTHPDQAGELLGSQAFIDSTDVDPVALFGAAVAELDPSGFEVWHFDNALAALGSTSGLPRPSAPLHVVFVTDQGNTGEIEQAAEFLERLRALVPNRFLRVSNLSGGLTGCSGAFAASPAHTELVSVSSRTGGHSGSICGPNPEQLLENLTETIVPGGVVLLSRPSRSLLLDLEVREPGGAFEATNSWSYDDDWRLLEVSSSGIPETGGALRATYSPVGCD